MIKPNTFGGLQYTEPEEQTTAKRADLITLPSGLPGTNCGNCVFFNNGNGFCKHVAVRLTVTDRMCCKFWKNLKQLNSWSE